MPKFHTRTLNRRLDERQDVDTAAQPTERTAARSRSTSPATATTTNPVVEDMVAMLNHNDISVRLLKDAQCCGMPKLELGDLEKVAKLKDANLPVFLAAIDDGYDLMAPIPSCVLMYKQEIPLMFPNDADVARVKAAFFDPFEYLMLRTKRGSCKTEFATSLGKVAYHVACHQRVQNIGAKTRDFMALIPGHGGHGDRTLFRPRRHLRGEKRDLRKGDEDRASGRDARRAGRSRSLRFGLSDGGTHDPARLEQKGHAGARRASDQPRAARLRNLTSCRNSTGRRSAGPRGIRDDARDFAREVIEHKKSRRVALGPHATLVFEDFMTMKYQVQEMLRVERIFEAAGIAEEIAAYNPLIPDGTTGKRLHDRVPGRRRAPRRARADDRRRTSRVGKNRCSRAVYAIANEDLAAQQRRKDRRRAFPALRSDARTDRQPSSPAPRSRSASITPRCRIASTRSPKCRARASPPTSIEAAPRLRTNARTISHAELTSTSWLEVGSEHS